MNTVTISAATLKALTSDTVSFDGSTGERVRSLLQNTRRNSNGSVTIAPEPTAREYLSNLASTILERDIRDEDGNLYADVYNPSRRLAALALEKALQALI